MVTPPLLAGGMPYVGVVYDSDLDYVYDEDSQL